MSLHVLPLHAGLCLHVQVYALLSLAVWILNMRNYGLLVYKKKKRTQTKRLILVSLHVLLCGMPPLVVS